MVESQPADGRCQENGSSIKMMRASGRGRPLFENRSQQNSVNGNKDSQNDQPYRQRTKPRTKDTSETQWIDRIRSFLLTSHRFPTGN